MLRLWLINCHVVSEFVKKLEIWRNRYQCWFYRYIIPYFIFNFPTRCNSKFAALLNLASQIIYFRKCSLIMNTETPYSTRTSGAPCENLGERSWHSTEMVLLPIKKCSVILTHKKESEYSLLGFRRKSILKFTNILLKF